MDTKRKKSRKRVGKIPRRIDGELLSERRLLESLLTMRKRKGLTQADIAEFMGTKPSAITRLETSLANGLHSPSLSTLHKYAKALNCRIDIRLVRNKQTSP